LVRPSKAAPNTWPADRVEVVHADLRRKRDLPSVVEGIDAIVHLAACVVGDDETQFVNTVVATENLLGAAVAADVDRFVLCSSFSVYDWRKPRRILNERSQLETKLYARDGYAVAKAWQERLVRRYAEQHDWRLTVMRPGFIWAPDAPMPAAVGHSVGRWHLVFGGLRTLPITYVENCAECFAAALDRPEAMGETFNIVDPERIRAWRFAGAYLRENRVAGSRVFIPYWCGLAAAAVASFVIRAWLGPTAKLPGLLVPIRYRARFRPLRATSAKAQSLLGWRPKWNFRQAWRRYGRESIPAAAAHRSATTATPLVPELAVD
jgi:UDP-glucose 4-epimerase